MSNKKIWIEKYRPTKLVNIFQNTELTTLLKNIIKTKNLPHLLLYGPPGSGKTTTAITITKELYKPQRKDFKTTSDYIKTYKKIFSERILELNASDERGIRVVREKIKNFASMAINNTYKNIPPYKIIILDEADAMTNDSQFALRRIIEKYSNITRFILLCNYITKIISPLASRCAKFRFQPITLEQTKFIINNILTKENIKYLPNDDVYKELYYFTEGDLRKSITIIQRAYFNNTSKIISDSDVKEIIGDIDNIILKKINNLIFSNDNEDQFYIKLNKLINNLLTGGYNIITYINFLIKFTINNNILTEKQKALISIKIAETNSNLDNGFNEYIQLLNLCSYIKLVNTNNYNIITNHPFTIDTTKIN